MLLCHACFLASGEARRQTLLSSVGQRDVSSPGANRLYRVISQPRGVQDATGCPNAETPQEIVANGSESQSPLSGEIRFPSPFGVHVCNDSGGRLTFYMKIGPPRFVEGVQTAGQLKLNQDTCHDHDCDASSVQVIAQLPQDSKYKVHHAVVPCLLPGIRRSSSLVLGSVMFRRLGLTGFTGSIPSRAVSRMQQDAQTQRSPRRLLPTVLSTRARCPERSGFLRHLGSMCAMTRAADLLSTGWLGHLMSAGCFTRRAASTLGDPARKHSPK